MVHIFNYVNIKSLKYLFEDPDVKGIVFETYSDGNLHTNTKS